MSTKPKSPDEGAILTRLSNNLKSFRKKKDLSQNDLSVQLGIKRATLAAYEELKVKIWAMKKSKGERLGLNKQTTQLFDIMKDTCRKYPRKLKKKLKNLGKYPPDTKKLLIEIIKGDEELGLYSE